MTASDASPPLLSQRTRVVLFTALMLTVLCAACANMVHMPGRDFTGPAPGLTPSERAIRHALHDDLAALTAFGERSTRHAEAYRKSAAWLEAELTRAGYTVTRQTYAAGGMEVANLVAERLGAARKKEVVVIGAHYDSAEGTPGANDNGSGVVATLALARDWAERDPTRTLRFVFFANEEPPYFQTEAMGSLVYARSCAARGDEVVAMLSLETIGYYSDDADSQHYPWPFNLAYPSTGNFLAFVGNVRSTRLTKDAVRWFRASATLPSQGAAVPDVAPGIGWSDHWAFWQIGAAAVMVTDTATFRYAEYHTPDDTPDKLDEVRFTRAVSGLETVVARLANPPQLIR